MCVWNRTRNTEWRRTFMSLRFEGEVFDGFFTEQEKMKNVKKEENQSKIQHFFEGENGRLVTEKKQNTCWILGSLLLWKKIYGARNGDIPDRCRKSRQTQTSTDGHGRTPSDTQFLICVWPCVGGVGLWLCLCLWLSSLTVSVSVWLRSDVAMQHFASTVHTGEHHVLTFLE